MSPIRHPCSLITIELKIFRIEDFFVDKTNKELRTRWKQTKLILCGDNVAERLERLTCNSEARSSSSVLTVSWICSRCSRVQILDRVCE